MFLLMLGCDFVIIITISIKRYHKRIVVKEMLAQVLNLLNNSYNICESKYSGIY